MQVKLKILKGSSSGKMLSVKGPKFLIGRGEDCQLRPHSDMISRRHCLITVSDDQVTAEELGSKNGTYVNGERIKGEVPLNNGDQLRVGPLEFEVCLLEPSETKQKAAQPAAAAKPQAAPDPAVAVTQDDLSLDDDVSGWLDEADSAEASRRLSEPDTRQFKLDDTQREALQQAEAEPEKGKKKGKKEKKEPGKLPPAPTTTGKDSKEAAALMLKKLFNRS